MSCTHGRNSPSRPHSTAALSAKAAPKAKRRIRFAFAASAIALALLWPCLLHAVSIPCGTDDDFLSVVWCLAVTSARQVSIGVLVTAVLVASAAFLIASE